MDKPTANLALSRITRWIVAIILVYAVWTAMFNPKPQQNAPVPGQPHEAASAPQPDCAKETSPLENFSMIASAMMPVLLPTVNVQDMTPGTGDTAICGQDATLHYEYALQDGTVIFSNLKDKDSTHITLGGGNLLHGAEVGMLGMKTGGTRKIAFPPALGIDRIKDLASLSDADHFTVKPDALKHAIIVSTVSLAALSPQSPSSPLPLRVIDHRFSSGARAQCGDTVRVRMTLWKLDGTKLFSTEDTGKPLVFTIGDSKTPYGIEQAVTGMGASGERTAIIPPAYGKRLQIKDVLQNTIPALLPSLHWPDEVVLASISLEHIGYEPMPAPAPKK